MFRKMPHLKESLETMFELGKKYAAEDSPSGLIAAFRIFTTIQENYPDKANQGQLGKVKEQLMRLGLLEKAIEDMKRADEKETKKQQISSFPARSKL